jgi:hypothetical protein
MYLNSLPADRRCDRFNIGPTQSESCQGYTSCQENGKYDRLYRRLAADSGMDTATVRFALKRL